MKILMIGATHGNELLGIRLYQYLLRKRSSILEHVDFIVGNPRAYRARKRYVNCDLNRSYGQMGSEYEKQRAAEIQSYIATVHPDIVLDMHTTVCHQPPCLIVNQNENSNVRRLLKASHITTILQVKSMNDIASTTPNAVGYEVPNSDITVALLEAIEKDLQRFVDGLSGTPRKQLYVMTDKIYKREVTDEQAESFVNFRMHSLGFVPIMTGNNSYKKQTDYLGFKSSAPQEITL